MVFARKSVYFLEQPNVPHVVYHEHLLPFQKNTISMSAYYFITSTGYNKRRDYFGMLCIILTTVDEKTILLGSELGTKFGCSGAPEFEVTCIVLHNNE